LVWIIAPVDLDTMVFVDDFETTDTSAWSSTFP
jgi:hypothetical protein